MAEIVTEDGSIYIYVHWHGSALPQMAEDAVSVLMASGRASDGPYAARIILDQLLREGRDQSTGFGLMLKPNCEDSYNGDCPSVIIDLPNKQLTVINTDITKEFKEI